MACKFAPLVKKYQESALNLEQARRLELHVELCEECSLLMAASGGVRRSARREDPDRWFSSYRARLAAETAAEVTTRDAARARAGFGRIRWLFALAGMLAGFGWSYAFLLR